MKPWAIIISLLVSACGQPGKVSDYSKREVESCNKRIDSLRETLLSERDSLRRVIHGKSDSLRSLIVKSDSLRSLLFLSNYKVEKVRFYLAICQRDRTQDKFLKGWVNRAVE